MTWGRRCIHCGAHRGCPCKGVGCIGWRDRCVMKEQPSWEDEGNLRWKFDKLYREGEPSTWFNLNKSGQRSAA